MQTITAKQLHQETKTILDQLEKGDALLITRNGRPVAKLEPIAPTDSPNWNEVMKEVWQAQGTVKPSELVPNPVLEERKRKRR